MNLDAGQTPSAKAPYFGTRGFAAPAISQVAEVSPGAMVHQAKKYRDESMAIYNSAREVLNQTSDASDAAERSSMRAAASEEVAMNSANSSMSNALLCNAYLGQTISVYNRTLAVGKRTVMLEQNITEMANRTLENTKKAAMSAQIAGVYRNDTESCRYNISVLIHRVAALEKRVLELEAR